MADHLSLHVRPAFPCSAIISERSSPSRVRFDAPNNGAPLTAPGRSEQHLLIGGKGSLRPAPPAGRHLAAILVPFSTATDRQFHAVALELDRHAHFPAWIAPVDVAAAATDPARRMPGPHFRDDCSRLVCQAQSRIPEEKLGLVEHLVTSRSHRFWHLQLRARRSFFSATVYLRPASVMSF